MSGEISKIKRAHARLAVSLRPLVAALVQPKALTEAIAERAQVRVQGAALGLTPEQTEEVITSTVDWYASQRGVLDIWGEIRRRLILRAMGLEWRT